MTAQYMFQFVPKYLNDTQLDYCYFVSMYVYNISINQININTH